jgi:tetratricopeptide (TPR) repeat protein
MTKKTNTVIATWVFGSLSFAFLIIVFWIAPKPLERFQLRIIAFVSSLLMGLFGYFLPGAVNIRVPGVRAGGGVALFLLTLWWWNSEFAPIKAAVATLPADIENYLHDEALKNNPAFSLTQETIQKLQGAADSSLRAALADGRLAWARHKLDREEYDQAIDHCNEALSFQPNYPFVNYFRAQAFWHLNKLNEALDDYSVVVKAAPEFGLALLGRMIVLGKLHRYRDAMNDAKALTRLGWSEPEHSLQQTLDSDQKGAR